MKAVLLRRAFFVAIWCVLWHFASRLADMPGFLPPPLAVAQSAVTILTNPFRSNVTLGHSYGTVLFTWIIGVAIAVALSIVISRQRYLLDFFSVPFGLGRTLPSVIAIPIFAVALGSTRRSVIACASFLVASYAMPSCIEAVSSLSALRRAIAEALGLTERQLRLYVMLPGISAAVQAIAIQTFGIALVVTVAGEMILALTGSVGDAVAQWSWLMRMTDVYGLILILCLFSALSHLLVALLPSIFSMPTKRALSRLSSAAKRN